MIETRCRGQVRRRAALARGDIESIMAYHHPDVIKALSYNNYLTGRDAVRADLLGTLQRFHLEFIEHRVESIFIQGYTAVEVSAFTIKGTPKNGDKPLFKGRAMVVYVRYKSTCVTRRVRQAGHQSVR